MAQPAIVPNFSPKPHFNHRSSHHHQHHPPPPQHRPVYLKRYPSSPASPPSPVTTTTRESQPHSTPQTPRVGSMVNVGDAAVGGVGGNFRRGRRSGGTDVVGWSDDREMSSRGHIQSPPQYSQTPPPLSKPSPHKLSPTTSPTCPTSPTSHNASTFPSVLQPAPLSPNASQARVSMSSSAVMTREVQKRGLSPFECENEGKRCSRTSVPAVAGNQTEVSVPTPRGGVMTANPRLHRVLSPAKSAPASLSDQEPPRHPHRDPRHHISSSSPRAGEPRSTSLDRGNIPPPRYAYNASSPEEEAHRAKLVRACEGLSSLCSQWHGSDYNRLKWGAKGSPVAYCPLTIVAPQHVAEIMNAQAVYESQLFASSDDELMGSGSEEGSGTSQSSRATTASDGEEVKTPGRTRWCESPIEGDVAVVDVTECAPSNVLDLHIERPKSLKEEEGFEGTSGKPQSLVRSPTRSPTRSTSGSPMQVDSPAPTRSNSIDVANSLREAMESALPAEVKKDDECVNAGVLVGNQTGTCENGAPMKETKTSDTHPINISLFLPDDLLPALPALIDIPENALASTPPRRPLHLSSSSDIFNMILTQMAAQAAQAARAAQIAKQNAQNGEAAPPPPPPMSIDVVPSQAGRGFGNLLLSSCPGKKVRLDGPVRGRGAICRDLTADLERVKGMGVGCIVCCLDDNELKFLGAPWAEYKKSAYMVGLDVVRIPMPEGLTPASLIAFDDHVEKVVRKYTLKGVSVLAHCRGGIGRAGLTACAWAVKLGMVGPSPDLENHLRNFATDGDDDCDSLTPVERENARVMSTVERVICLIRRRRSVKAIETFEQVNFLATYIAWLRRQSGQAEMAERKLLA